jgi:hypothetical protein
LWCRRQSSVLPRRADLAEAGESTASLLLRNAAGISFDAGDAVTIG